jgi:hypothetical protein
MSDAQEHLDLVNAVIKARLTGDVPEEYQHGVDRYRYSSLAQLYDIRDRLRNEIASTNGGGGFVTLVPTDG